ncbi:MAG: SDR family oxidoreductase [Kangiellaceae bacterium]|jgi:UDP-glucose 4-epimerase|nr:SDR family oxidoreductase [Kangiellaceae bacterium]
MTILITGSEGYLGQRLVKRLSAELKVVGIDIRDRASANYDYRKMDIRDAGLSEFIGANNITHVIHLASVMQASADRSRDFDIDVNGTNNVLEACVANEVKHITITSSGAAYGYHADNPEWLVEDDPLRGNDSFAYSQHKRLIEEMLSDYQTRHPKLKQLVLRPGTVLGKHTNNQITNLFQQKRLLAVQGSPSPFVFIWDEDVVNIMVKGTLENKVGRFNLAGDGALTINDIAAMLNKPLLVIPAWLLKVGLYIGHALKLTQYSVEQLDFLRYRPVLDNAALKNKFGYTPKKTSQEVFAYYLKHNQVMAQ